jgi:hypothetical protein
MLTPLKGEIETVDDLSHEARRFRTVMRSFERNLELLFNGTGLVAEVDHEALATAFSRWRQAFDQSKHFAGIDRHDFVIYAAGLMLKELIAARPVRKLGKAVDEALPALPQSLDHRLERWPEGYAYTSFCLSVAAAILKSEGEAEPPQKGPADDPAFWDSFRENSLQSPAAAIAFFDLVCGLEPNWEAPDVPWMRKSFMARMASLKAETPPPGLAG